MIPIAATLPDVACLRGLAGPAGPHPRYGDLHLPPLGTTKSAGIAALWNTSEADALALPLLPVSGTSILDATIAANHLSRTTGGQHASRAPVVDSKTLLGRLQPFFAPVVRFPRQGLAIVTGLRGVLAVDARDDPGERPGRSPLRVVWMNELPEDARAVLIPRRAALINAQPPAGGARQRPPATECSKCADLEGLVASNDARERRLQDRHTRELREQKAKVATANATIRQMKSDANEAKGAANKTVEELERRQEDLVTKDTEIGRLKTALVEKDKDIQRRDAEIAALKRQVADKDAEIARLKAAADAEAEASRLERLARARRMMAETAATSTGSGGRPGGAGSGGAGRDPPPTPPARGGRGAGRGSARGDSQAPRA